MTNCQVTMQWWREHFCAHSSAVASSSCDWVQIVSAPACAATHASDRDCTRQCCLWALEAHTWVVTMVSKWAKLAGSNAIAYELSVCETVGGQTNRQHLSHPKPALLSYFCSCLYSLPRAPYIWSWARKKSLQLPCCPTTQHCSNWLRTMQLL